MDEYNLIQNAISDLLNVHRPYENDINNSKKIKDIELFVFPLVSYADGISILMKECKYDSVYPVGRAFLEIYAPLVYLINNYYDADKYNDYFSKLLVDNMVQDIKTYYSFKSDVTIENCEKQQREVESYIISWEQRINEYFPNYKSRILLDKKEKSLIKIIKTLEKEYEKKYPCKNNFIRDTINDNTEFALAFGKKYESSGIVYRLLCHETHANVDALDRRATNNGYFISNKSSKGDAIAISQLIYWSIKDVSSRLKQLLEKEFK